MATQHRIGKYLAEKALGAGSFATVWLAFDELLEVQVAVKVLADNWARNVDIRRRFIEEARLLRRIDHDRVVRVFDVDELADGRPYFVMAVADQGTLHERLDENGKGRPMDTERALRLGLEICEALSIVHDFGVVHRDIKPSNILFRSIRNHERVAAQRAGRIVGDDAVMIGDFGLAKDLAVASGFTLAAGTPAYMAPEQAHATSVIDRRVDVFATAAVIYEMLAGHPAFASETLSGVRRSRAESLAQPLSEVRPDLPVGLSDILARGMARAPEDRFDSCFTLADALTEFIPGAAPQIAAPPPLVPMHTTRIEVRLPEQMPPPQTSVPASMPLTGVAGRVNDLLSGSRLLVDGKPVAETVMPRLTRPFTSTVVGPTTPQTLLLAAGMRMRSDMDAHHATNVAAAEVAESDLVVLLLAADEPDPVSIVNDLLGVLKAAPVGPYAVRGLVTPKPGCDPQRVLDAVRASVAASTLLPDLGIAGADEIAAVQADATLLAEARGLVFRAVSGLRIIQLASKQAPAGPATTELLDRIRSLQDELPVLVEVELLREIVSGRTVLPRLLRSDVTRVLIHARPALRLGLDIEADAAALRAAVEAKTTEWLRLENLGRVPFSARGAMRVASQALARVHAELAGFG